MDQFNSILQSDFFSSLRIPKFKSTDYIEILIIAFLIYHIIVWAKNTKAWSLLKGVGLILLFIAVASYFQMNTVLWIARNGLLVAAIALIVVLQPELRKALEELGKTKIFSKFFQFDSDNTTGLFSDNTISEIAKASIEMGRARTGALIVVKQNDNLEEYERTGIEVDGIVTSQLLINIFEHNTPLHDGAVVIKGDRVAAATCYLPLSDNRQISKELGTRHRAGVGISEATDSMTIIVSEETGKISVAYNGKLERNLSLEQVKERLSSIQNKVTEEKHRKLIRGKGAKDGKGTKASDK